MWIIRDQGVAARLPRQGGHQIPHLRRTHPHLARALSERIVPYTQKTVVFDYVGGRQSRCVLRGTGDENKEVHLPGTMFRFLSSLLTRAGKLWKTRGLTPLSMAARMRLTTSDSAE